MFVDPDVDYRLKAVSPSIDAGTNSGAPTEDIDGNARPIDGDGDDSAITDMGAYEYVPPWYVPPKVVVGGMVSGESRLEILAPVIGLATAGVFILWRSAKRYRRKKVNR
jgi:hypothetical protein